MQLEERRQIVWHYPHYWKPMWSSQIQPSEKGEWGELITTGRWTRGIYKNCEDLKSLP